MAPGHREPSERVMKLLEKSFGSWDEFVAKFVEEGAAQFGSGWVWLVEHDDELKIIKTANAKNPLVLGKKPLIGCDVWEHSYYVDFQNRRPDYLKSFITNLVNWAFVEKHYRCSFFEILQRPSIPKRREEAPSREDFFRGQG